MRLDGVDENNFTFLHSTYFYVSNERTKSRFFTVFRSERCNYQVLGLTKETRKRYDTECFAPVDCARGIVGHCATQQSLTSLIG
jgi:hypothetical protein